MKTPASPLTATSALAVVTSEGIGALNSSTAQEMPRYRLKAHATGVGRRALE